MQDSDFLKSYPAHVAHLKDALKGNIALEQAVGGNFMTVGRLQLFLLQSLGLQGRDFVVDAGCGCGRLAVQLAYLPQLKYLGTDIVPSLLNHARKLARRPDWRFECTNGLVLPTEDNTADFVCFFSVFTHLQHEDTFRYLAEAKRVLRPGGKIVFSFLEFHIYSHWEVFRHSLSDDRNQHLNQFMDRGGINAFAHHLSLHVDVIADGDKPHIPIDGDLVWDDGRITSGTASLGQSVAVFSKPLIDRPRPQ